ncbi:MAG: hypothetical protein ACRDDH_00020 [Cetobacterium sp.]|uniref:hypothetical protein n=1 Tax=Cetobacterium sp. TaxID=2071632 RepID=UPI003EE42E35
MENAEHFKPILCDHCLPKEEGQVILIKRCFHCFLFRPCKHNLNKIYNPKFKFCQCHLIDFDCFDPPKFDPPGHGGAPFCKSINRPIYTEYFKPKFYFGDL